eukprot:CFRG1049T1
MSMREISGKKILWLTAYYTHESYGSVRELMLNVKGYNARLWVVFHDSPENVSLSHLMAEDGLLEDGGSIFCNMNDNDNASDNVHKAVVETGIEFDGVFSPHEGAMTLIGELCDHMNLPGNSADAYYKARDKKLGREACVAAGVPSPRFEEIKKREDIPDVVSRVGLPLVMKPSSGAGSDGVFKCSDVEEVYSNYDKVIKEIEENDTFKINAGLTISLIVEEYIDGDEFDIDVLMWDGECVYVNIIDNWPTMEPTFLEIGSNCPTVYPSKPVKQLHDYSIDCVRAMGFKQGCFHVECKYSRKEHRLQKDADGDVLGTPLLIEVNARMGGGRTHLFHKEVYHIDLFEYFFLTHCGVPIAPKPCDPPATYLADYEFCAEITGIIAHDKFLDGVKEDPNVVLAKTYHPPGTRVKGCDSGVPEWCGLILVKGDSAEEVVKNTRALGDSVMIPIISDKIAKGRRKSSLLADYENEHLPNLEARSRSHANAHSDIILTRD